MRLEWKNPSSLPLQSLCQLSHCEQAGRQLDSSNDRVPWGASASVLAGLGLGPVGAAGAHQDWVGSQMPSELPEDSGHNQSSVMYLAYPKVLGFTEPGCQRRARGGGPQEPGGWARSGCEGPFQSSNFRACDLEHSSEIKQTSPGAPLANLLLYFWGRNKARSQIQGGK